MPSPSGPSATSAHVSIDIRRFPWIRPLAADYAFHYDRLADFFAGDPRSRDAWRTVEGRVRAVRREGRIADVLEAQQRRRGAPAEAVAAAAALRHPETTAIVTGQQAGLFGGPLFTLLKALTALRLAADARQERGATAVAVFWIDAEDHDWDEVRACGVLDNELALQRITVGHPPGAGQRPVGSVGLDGSVEAACEQLAQTLPATEFTHEILDQLRAAYRPGTGMAEAFARWLERVLGPRGLVVFDASDAGAKPLVADLFAREVERGQTTRLAAHAGAELSARGYHVQVTPHEDHLALFHLHDGRQAIRRDGDGFHLEGGHVSTAALRDRVREAPAEFSPNVLLRPLVQDTLFPTVCYVAGPNELAYLAQIRPVYEAFEIPMPLVHMRASATLLDTNAQRFLARHPLPFEALAARDDGALNQLLAAHLPADVDAALGDVAREVERGMQRLADAVPAVDPTLEGAARSTLGRMQDDLKKLQSKIVQAAKRKDDTLRRQFFHARAQAFPGGGPQEREVGFVYFLNRYGPVLIDRLHDELPLEMGTHWLVTI